VLCAMHTLREGRCLLLSGAETVWSVLSHAFELAFRARAAADFVVRDELRFGLLDFTGERKHRTPSPSLCHFGWARLARVDRGAGWR
jgi:hypothetical protein